MEVGSVSGSGNVQVQVSLQKKAGDQEKAVTEKLVSSISDPRSNRLSVKA